MGHRAKSTATAQARGLTQAGVKTIKASGGLTSNGARQISRLDLARLRLKECIPAWAEGAALGMAAQAGRRGQIGRLTKSKHNELMAAMRSKTNKTRALGAVFKAAATRALTPGRTKVAGMVAGGGLKRSRSGSGAGNFSTVGGVSDVGSQAQA